MNTTAEVGIAILLTVSLLVRIAPAFIQLPLSAERFAQVEAVLPVAVLINLAVFSAVSEIKAQPIQASVGLLLLVVLFAWRRLPVIVVVLLASLAYAGASTLGSPTSAR